MQKFKPVMLRVGAWMSAVLATACSVRPAQAISFSVGEGGQITVTPDEMPSIGGNNWQEMLGSVITKYKGLASIILGLCTITALVCLVISIAKLAGSSVDSAPMARRRATIGILISGSALVLFGGLTAVVGFFWNFLNAPL